MAIRERPTAPGSLVRAGHPWNDAVLARLYDAFPFDADLPLYRELAQQLGGVVLEVACGSGRVLVPIAQAGHRIVGLDASPHMLALAREKLDHAGPEVSSRAKLVETEMRDFDLGETFDLAIIAVKSLAYLVRREDQQRTLGTIARHLRPGGLLALDLMNPSPTWLLEPPGSLRQDLVRYVPEMGATVTRTETVVNTDRATQVRTIRSAYEVVRDDGSVMKRFVEWPYRYIYRFEAELLLEHAGFEVAGLYGGYQREPFMSESPTMLFLARRT